MPKVSVLCTVYNQCQYLPLAVESVLAQNADFELILVDDGSTDGARDYVQSLDDPRVTVVLHPQNRGRSRAVNTAFSHARGEYIALIDADDVWEPGKLALQTALLDAEPETTAVFSHVTVIDSQGNNRNADSPKLLQVFNQTGATRFSMLRTMFFSGNFCNTSSAVLRRSALDCETPFFDIRMKHLHDQDLWVRLLFQGDARIIPKPLVRYRVHGDNMSFGGAEVQRRSQLEQALILERFAALKDPVLFARIFPEAQDFRPVTRENIPYYVSRLAMGHEYPICANWGLLLLSDLLKTEAGAEAIAAEFGLSLLDYYTF